MISNNGRMDGWMGRWMGVLMSQHCMEYFRRQNKHQNLMRPRPLLVYLSGCLTLKNRVLPGIERQRREH